MSYGILFWGNFQIALKSSKRQRGQIELLQEARIAILAEIY
jgi:hypothetical protein